MALSHSNTGQDGHWYHFVSFRQEYQEYFFYTYHVNHVVVLFSSMRRLELHEEKNQCCSKKKPCLNFETVLYLRFWISCVSIALTILTSVLVSFGVCCVVWRYLLCSEPTRKGVLVQLACVVVAWRTLQMKRSCVSLAKSCRKMCEANVARSVVYITWELKTRLRHCVLAIFVVFGCSCHDAKCVASKSIRR